jgi:peptidoglycan hydrolase-like protein with peptidoglycan-binding domain
MSNPLLQKGASDESVKRLQARLGLSADGLFGPRTEAAVRQFQRENGLAQDGVVGPRTWAALEAGGGEPVHPASVEKREFQGRAEPLSAGGAAEAAAVIGAPPDVLWTVVRVETSGCGFLPDRSPSLLFERHEFRKRTGGRFDSSHPHISGTPGGYGLAGANQHKRLAQAIACDRRAALESASWGLGQIMGYNARLAGYAEVEDMAADFTHGEDAQLLAMARFICGTRLDRALARRDWAAFARGYNGPNFSINRYDSKLAAQYDALARTGLPDLSLRAAQLMLLYEGYDPGPIDGLPGPRVNRAIAAFRTASGLVGKGVDPELLDALYARLAPAERQTHAPS